MPTRRTQAECGAGQGTARRVLGPEREPVVSVADGQLRPRWRGHVHLGGFLITLPAGLILLWLSESLTAGVAVAIYVAGMLALFGTSAAYHLLARTERAQRLMRRADHSMIFVQIAGTYTPVCLLALPPEWGLPVLAVIWASCVAGVLIKLLAGERILRWSNGLYIFLGWVALLMLPVILRHLTDFEFLLLVIGGVVYTIGAVLFYYRLPRLRPAIFGYHEVWHIMTVLAAVAHFGMVWSVAG